MFVRLITCCIAILTSSFAQAEIRALVIGVSDYAYIDADLKGPANDVGLVASTLLARGSDPKNIRVLAAPDVKVPAGVTVFSSPTRDAILNGFADLATSAKDGDTVFIFYSGHGSQAPDQNGDEAGGFDEILLAADTKGWGGSTGLVQGAILDDELSTRIQSILDTGAQVIAILDACHSATGFRDLASPASAARYVDPAALGVPATSVSTQTSATPNLKGDFAFLYSAQSDERAFESPLGDSTIAENWYGDFTKNLMTALNGGHQMTWAQALDAAMNGLQSKGPARQTPDGEGPLLSAPVFGVSANDGFVDYANGQISVGAVHGVTKGAIFALYHLDNQDKSFGRVTINDVTPTSALFIHDTKVPKTGFARLVQAGPLLPFRIAITDTAEHWVKKLSKIVSETDGLVVDKANPDLLLVPEKEGLALAYPNGTLDPLGPGSSFRIKDAQELKTSINRLAALHRLSQSLTQSAKSGKFSFSLPGSEVQTSLNKVTASGNCGSDAAPEPTPAPAKVAHCDQLWLDVYNPSITAQDVTVLYINRDFTITAIWPIGGISNRINPDERQNIGMQIQNEPDTAGFEEILILSVPAKTGARRTDLSGLATDAATRSNAADDTLIWLFDTMDGQQSTRSTSGKTPKITTKRIPIKLQSQKG